MIRKFVITSCCALALTGCATTYSVSPIADSTEPVRYLAGVPTVTSDDPKGSVEVTPLGFNQFHQLQFGVAAFNRADQASNFGLENVAVYNATGATLPVYTRDQLERQARDRAIMAGVLVAAAGGLSAYAANAGAYSTTRGYVATPYGTSRFAFRSYDPGAAYAGTALAGAATGAGLASIQNSLNNTIASLNGRLLQTTTVEPGQSFGGVVISAHPQGDYPQTVEVRVNWNGEAHSFKFTIAKS